jgi:carbon monoxide dehydrogenase subunit G
MISLSEQITIPSPPEVVWPLLADPGLVASCIPGATMTPAAVLGVYAGTLRVKFGPTVAVFRGEARLSYDHDARRVTVEGRGIDARGQSRAVASGVVSASGTDTTVLKLEGSFNVTGPLETFANAGGVHVARALLAEFSANMAQLLTAEGTPAPEAEEIPMVEPETVSRQLRAAAAVAPPVPPAAELRGGALLWGAFRLWLRQVFSGKGKQEPR